jgi:ABC-type glycerol-3-phosphate transport system substrate-binding protein
MLRFSLTGDLRDEEYIYPQKMATDAAGRIYLVNNGTVYIWDAQGGFLNKIALSGNAADISLDRAGEKIFASWLGRGGTLVAALDPDAGTLGQSYQLEDIYAVYGTGPGASGDLLIASENGVYAYDHKNRRHDKIFAWADVDMSVDFNGFFLPLADGRVGWIKNEFPDRYADFRVVRPLRAGEEPPAKEAIVLGGLSFFSIDTSVRNAVKAFNDTHSRCRIEIKEYGEGDYGAGINQLNMEIVNGIGPDIVILPIRFSMELYARKGVLTDLYPFIDSDGEMARGDFYENILKAYETGDSLFGIPVWFEFQTIVAAQAEVGDISGWNLDTMMDYVNGRFPASPVFENASKSEVFSLCLFANGDALADWHSAGGGFDRDLFLKMLYFADRFTPDHLYAYEENIARRIQDDDKLQLLTTNVGGYYSHRLYRELFGGPAAYPGYPAENGNGNVIISRSVMAISAGCRDKEAAWEFLRSMLNEEVQSSPFIGLGFPILKSAHEALIKEALTAVYKEENGIKTEEPKGTGSLGDYHFDIYAAAEEDIEALRNLIESANRIRSHDGVISNIALEEAQSFFSGAKTAEEAADIAENRIRIYVEEMK